MKLDWEAQTKDAFKLIGTCGRCGEEEVYAARVKSSTPTTTGEYRWYPAVVCRSCGAGTLTISARLKSCRFYRFSAKGYTPVWWLETTEGMPERVSRLARAATHSDDYRHSKFVHWLETNNLTELGHVVDKD